MCLAEPLVVLIWPYMAITSVPCQVATTYGVSVAAKRLCGAPRISQCVRRCAATHASPTRFQRRLKIRAMRALFTSCTTIFAASTNRRVFLCDSNFWFGDCVSRSYGAEGLYQRSKDRRAY